MLAVILALEVKIGALERGNPPGLREAKLVLKELKLPPEGKGGPGWTSPSSVSASYDDEISPRIARDAYGVLWAALNNASAEFPNVNLYYSTDNGLTWNYYTTVSGDSCRMGALSLVYEPYQNVLLLSFTGEIPGESLKIGVCAWDVVDTAQLDSFRYTCFEGSGNLDSPALAVERGHSPNYVFWTFKYRVDSTEYVMVYRCTNLDSFNWNYVVSWSGTNYYLSRLWANASDRVVQVTFRGGADSTSPTDAYYAYSTDRGCNWQLLSLDASSVGVVGFTSPAAAVGSDYAVWALQIDDDLYLLYSQDLGASWPYSYWLECDSAVVSKTPLVLADGGDFKGPSAYFYLLAYRDGNILFKIARVEDASEASAWLAPAGRDTLLIPEEDLADYSVWDEPWPIQLGAAVVPTGGGYGVSAVWAHEYSAADHDVYFSRSEGALFMGSGEGESARALRLLTPVSSGELRFSYPPEMEGRALRLYDAKGSLVAELKLAERVRVNLPSGVYLWRAGEAKGRLVLKR